MTVVTQPETPAPDALALKAALDAKRDELAAMPASDIIANPRLDASAAAGIVMGSLRRIEKHRPAIEAQFGAEGAAYVDDLRPVVYATEQANIEHAGADSASDLTAMHEGVLEDHALLVTDADALVNRKLLDRGRVDAGRSTQGYRTTITSTLVLVALFREQWSKVAGKTPITHEDLDRAERKAQQMLLLLNDREQGTSRLPAAELRTRAVSMLIRTYGEVRRMIEYVRYWDGDADTIAPSLWSGRRGRGRNGSEDEDVVLDPTQPMPGVPNNGGGPFTS